MWARGTGWLRLHPQISAPQADGSELDSKQARAPKALRQSLSQSCGLSTDSCTAATHVLVKGRYLLQVLRGACTALAAREPASSGQVGPAICVPFRPPVLAV